VCECVSLFSLFSQAHTHAHTHKCPAPDALVVKTVTCFTQTYAYPRSSDSQVHRTHVDGNENSGSISTCLSFLTKLCLIEWCFTLFKTTSLKSSTHHCPASHTLVVETVTARQLHHMLVVVLRFVHTCVVCVYIHMLRACIYVGVHACYVACVCPAPHARCKPVLCAYASCLLCMC